MVTYQHTRRIHLGPVAGDHAATLHPLQARLHRAAGDAEPPGGLEHADPRLGGQQFDERSVEAVDQPRVTGSHDVQRYHRSFGVNSQFD
jgi:hypothetical protein